MNLWPPLQAGDVVDVISPGSASPLEQLDKSKKFLTSWGLIPRIPAGLMAPHYFHSNDDEHRFEFLKAALLSDSKLIWCLRGGYGSNRLLPRLAKMKKPKTRKLLLGLSDVSSLHVFLNQEWKWPTIHGPLLDRFALDKVGPKEKAEMKQVLFGRQTEIVFTGLHAMNKAAEKVKRLKAPMTGGNLLTLESAIGTPWEVDLKGKFLFLEEVGERGYRVDRMFEHFEQAKILKGCKGVFIGDFTGGEEADGTSMVKPAIRRWAESAKVPVWKGVPCGHDEIQRPVIFGSPVELIRKNGFELRASTVTASRASGASGRSR